MIIDNLDASIRQLEDNKKINKIREMEVCDSNADGIVL